MTATPADDPETAPDPVALGMELLSDRVSLLVLRDVFRGKHRYQQFKNDLGLSHAVLADRLRHLEDAGLIAARAYSTHPPLFEYLLTPKGHSYWPVVVSLWRWEALWSRDPSATLPSVRHRVCGNVVQPWFGCTACGVRVGMRDHLDVGVTTQELFDILSRTPHRYRRSGARSQTSLSSGAADGVFTVLRDRWTLLILLAFIKGLARFTEIQRGLGISPTLLSRHLDEMTVSGVIEPIAVPGRSHRAYRLLEKGGDLRPALVLSHLWANEWRTNGPRRDLLLHHGDHQLAPAWFCDACDVPLDRAAVVAEGIPEYDEARLALSS